MVILTENMKEAFSKLMIIPLATASKEGTPNVVPMRFCELMDDETIWFADNFMVKTLTNIQENPQVAIYVWGSGTGGCFQIKGNAEVKTEGPDHKKMREWVHSVKPGFPAKSLVIVKITDVFQCSPGSEAGKKLL